MSKRYSTDYFTAEIIEDEDEHDIPSVCDTSIQTFTPVPLPDPVKVHSKKPLQRFYQADPSIHEIGVDEAGRGPLFGRVYTAAVILPKEDPLFDHSKMKDSKKFHSKKKIKEVAEYIKENALYWAVSFEDEKVIDEINILQATQKSMHHSIEQVIRQYKQKEENDRKEKTEKKDNSISFQLLIDGNYFKPYGKYPYICVEGGDNKYTSIAAASILAKVERDKYIEEMCEEYPELKDKYGLDTNKGYGSKKHIEGIKQHGITIWHRRSFGICNSFV